MLQILFNMTLWKCSHSTRTHCSWYYRKYNVLRYCILKAGFLAPSFSCIIVIPQEQGKGDRKNKVGQRRKEEEQKIKNKAGEAEKD